MKEKIKNFKIHPIIFYTFLILFLEIISRIFITKSPFGIGILYTLIFSIPIIILLTAITKLFPPKAQRFILILITLIITIYFEVQFVFLELFPEPFEFTTIGLADQAADNFNLAIDEIKKQIGLFITLLIPFILSIITFKKIDTTKYNGYNKAILIGMCIIAYLSTYLTLIPFNNTTKKLNSIYSNTSISKLSIIDNFGMLTFLRKDLTNWIFGNETQSLSIEETPVVVPEEIVYEQNKLDLNFSKPTDNKSIKELNTYFSQIDGTYQNEYTGMFEGKNLIFILAEGFN